jgi:hypothetical protein
MIKSMPMWRYNKILLIISYVFFHQAINGQTVLMEEKINAYDFKLPTKGPNFRHFNHLYIGFGFFIPDANAMEVKTKPASTTSFEFGWRYKLKLTNWFALGAGISYKNDIFDIKQIENKIIPDSVSHTKEKLRFNYLGSEAYIRFNFGKRGNIVGRFIDFGAYANWAFRVKHMMIDKVDENVPHRAGSQRVILYKLDYIEKFCYGLKARIGSNRLVLTADYRMSELFTDDYKAEVGNYYLPKFAVGFEFGLHK